MRHRVTVVFVVVTLLVSSAAMAAVWLVARHYLLAREEAVAATAARVTGSSVARALHHTGEDPAHALDRVTARQGAAAVLRFRGSWYASSPVLGPQSLPAPLVREVESGTQATRRVSFRGRDLLVTGVPLHHGDAFFRLSGLDKLRSTFDVLRTTLVAVTAALVLAALALGRFASRIALRPLADLTRVAGAAARGEPGARLTGVDDPDLARLVASFNENAHLLEQRVVADARFAGDVSHELRTPLTTMVNSLQLIKNREAQLPPEVREPLSMLEEDLDRFQRLVVDLIEMSRADGRAQLRLERLPIAEAVREAADRAAGRPVTVVDPSVQGMVAEVDRNRLARVVSNLVENAEQHGGGCVRVSVSGCDAEVRIVVDDAGPGIPESLRERVFERFVRGIDGSPGGNGLGLAIVARQVQGHGGRVLAEERPGGGARFVVALPRTRR